jgi:hypothetical protein
MDPEACLRALAESMENLHSMQEVPNPPAALVDDMRDCRDEISEGMQNLAGWIERGGFCPDPNGWRTK